MKKGYMIASLYTLLMAIGLVICRIFFQTAYTDPRFIIAFLPILAGLTVFSGIAYKKYGKTLGNEAGEYKLFLLLFVPVALSAVFTIVQKHELTTTFFFTLLGAFLVGVNEEVIYRGIVFPHIAEEKGLLKGVIFSALAFSLLHAVNIVGGLPLKQMILQLMNTFFGGIFYALSYRYTKSLWLLIILHSLWDYVPLTKIGKDYPVIEILFFVLMAVEWLISFLLWKKYQINKCEGNANCGGTTK